jgi:short-subunit dehydrogenase
MSDQVSKGIAVVTGASSGIGAIYADRLAKRGYDLLLVARDNTRLNQVAGVIRDGSGRNVETLLADLTNKAELAKVEDRLRSDERITALINNAGFGGVAGLLQSNVDELENMIALNVTALTRLTAAVLPGLVARAHGLVINIASVVAINPESLNGTYSGTKAYVVNFTQALFKELKGKGVQVQAVLPGATKTEFWGRFGVPHSNIEAILMSSEDCVDAALAGLDQQELITIPALPDVSYQARYEEARLALYPFLSNKQSADRYKVHA